jgi:TonB family protein
MDRLQKKCLAGSVLLHASLGGILIFSAAFQQAKPQPTPYLELVGNFKISDDLTHGGNPAPVEVAQPLPLPQPKPQPQPIEPTPPAPVAKAEVKQPEPEPEKQVINSIIPDITIKEPSKRDKKPVHTVKVNLNEMATAKDRHAAEKAARAAAMAEQKRIVSKVHELGSGLASTVRSSAAKSTVVDMPGQGGGEAFANYRDVVFNTYYNAWIAPDDVLDKQSTAVARIVIARDGAVISAEIIKNSSSPVLDKSVQSALKRVTKLAPFPEATLDLQRTFKINFNLEDKQSFG